MEIVDCPTCDGKGAFRYPRTWKFIMRRKRIICFNCKGKGTLILKEYGEKGVENGK